MFQISRLLIQHSQAGSACNHNSYRKGTLFHEAHKDCCCLQRCDDYLFSRDCFVKMGRAFYTSFLKFFPSRRQTVAFLVNFPVFYGPASVQYTLKILPVGINLCLQLLLVFRRGLWNEEVWRKCFCFNCTELGRHKYVLPPGHMKQLRSFKLVLILHHRVGKHIQRKKRTNS